MCTCQMIKEANVTFVAKDNILKAHVVAGSHWEGLSVMISGGLTNFLSTR